MFDDLETLYRVLTREQSTRYSGSSVLGGFEEFVSGWCNRVLIRNNDQQVQKVLHDMKLAAEGYGTAKSEVRERKIAEMGRMLLSLRDLLQLHLQIPERKGIGIAYKQEGRFPEAIAEFEKALESNSHDHFALSQLAHIYLQQDKLDESSRLIDRALKLNPDNPFAHGIKGEILFKEGNMGEAAAVFEEILNLNPYDTYAYSKLGVIYRKQGRLAEATSILNRGLEVNPEDSSLHHALGDVYAWQDKDEEAIEEYEKAISLDPGDEYAFRGLMSSKAKVGARGRVPLQSIITQLQKILKIPSRRQNPHLHALLAKYLKQEKQYEAAAGELREALLLQSHSIYFQTQLAFCYSKLGQYSRVIELLEPIHRVRSRDPIIIQSLTKAYEGAGRIEDARRMLIDALYIYPNDRALRSALMKLSKQGSGNRNQVSGSKVPIP